MMNRAFLGFALDLPLGFACRVARALTGTRPESPAPPTGEALHILDLTMMKS
jgi:hypothetical protein